MPWYALTVDVAEEEADDAAALLLEQGAGGAEVRDRSVSPMPGSPLPGAGRALVVAYFLDAESASAAAEATGLAGSVREVADEDWSEAWKRDLTAFTVGRVFVRPSWIEADPPVGTIEVVLDPGMAFGTGTHPTTALCLRAVDVLLSEAPGADVLDVGTGSGLLAIAARKLGARRVVATENDPTALDVAAENAARNGVELDLRLEEPAAIPGQFPIVLANILANTLIFLAPGIAERIAPGGTVVLAGILAGQDDEVRAAYVRRGLEARSDLDASDGEWRRVALRKPA
jgi:ribosomal protein L11 methyltransferase